MKSVKLLQKYFLNKQPATGPVKQTDFAMHLEPVDTEAYKKELFSSGFDAKVLEAIQYKGQSYEIFQVDIATQKPSRRLLIFAGVHGNEFAAALAVNDILDDIQKHPKLYANWHVRIVTPLNPAGFAHQSRYNEDGRDINRDFKNFVTTGGKLQKESIEQFAPDLLVSLHEGPQDEFFVIAEGNVPKAWQQHIAAALKAERVTLARKSFFGMKISEGFWRKPRFVYALQKLMGVYTLGRYAYKHGIPLITTESPWKSTDVTARRRTHALVIKALVESN